MNQFAFQLKFEVIKNEVRLDNKKESDFNLT